MANSGPISPDDLIVLDVGAEAEHYAADISRTVSQQPISGRNAEVFKAVEAVQDYALGSSNPACSTATTKPLLRHTWASSCCGSGVIREATREQIRRYYPHATSHFLGLDTHDVGDYRQPLTAGMVITCEPGIYLPEEGIGVRIEDDVLITEKGYTVLSRACPRALTLVQ
ncbi:MAG: M24 family metallopeptidase [Candidatus Saccharibacteria bacterium]